MIATIRKARPDLLMEFSTSVDLEAAWPEDMPVGFLEKHVDQIQDIGQPVTACFMTRTDIDPRHW